MLEVESVSVIICTSHVDRNKSSNYCGVTGKGANFETRRIFFLKSSIFFMLLLFHMSQCEVSPRATSLWAKQAWCLMRKTLTGSLSQSCHPTLTLLIPHVTQGAPQNVRRTIKRHLPALVHTQTNIHILASLYSRGLTVDTVHYLAPYP